MGNLAFLWGYFDPNEKEKLCSFLGITLTFLAGYIGLLVGLFSPILGGYIDSFGGNWPFFRALNLGHFCKVTFSGVTLALLEGLLRLFSRGHFGTLSGTFATLCRQQYFKWIKVEDLRTAPFSSHANTNILSLCQPM